MAAHSTINNKGSGALRTEANLVKACLRGNASAERALYDQFKQQMFRICLRYASSRQDAEDYLQDAFIRVFRDLKQYRGDGPLGAWIRKVVVNSILQDLRKRRIVFSETDISAVSNALLIEDDLPGNLDAEILTKYIQTLPDGYRTVFNMYVIEGFSHQEIAEELDITTGTSKSQLSKARAMLRSKIEAMYSQEKI